MAKTPITGYLRNKGDPASPGRSVRQEQASQAVGPIWRHPDYAYWQSDWQMLRDMFMGEREVKAKGEHYLPRMEGMTPGDYRAYLKRSTYYNMISRTVYGLQGSLFRRQAEVSGVPKRLVNNMKTIGRSGESLFLLMRLTGLEMLLLGRFGVLVDRPTEPGGAPFLATYLAENIVDWVVVEADGKYILQEVILREFSVARDTSTFVRRYFAGYRRLFLDENGEYTVAVYRPNGADADIATSTAEIFKPTNRGRPLREIPFVFFGPESNLPDIQKPPVLDIATLNLSHYRSYAQLEHGRFYTGLPIYYCPSDSNEKGEYLLGPSVVWEVAPGEKPGVIEFNGHGLTFLENALTQKENQVASLGGRLLGTGGSGAAESDNALMMKDRNERSVLLSVAFSIDDGFTKLLQYWAAWQDASDADIAKISVETNKDFLLDKASAREFRAIQAMYMDGVIPIEVVYDYLKRADVIPDWLSIDEFTRLINSTASFPMQPDAEARSEGFPDKKTQIDDENADLDREAQQKQADAMAKQRAATGNGGAANGGGSPPPNN